MVGTRLVQPGTRPVRLLLSCLFFFFFFLCFLHFQNFLFQVLYGFVFIQSFTFMSLSYNPLSTMIMYEYTVLVLGLLK